jgi:hypothetical protein
VLLGQVDVEAQKAIVEASKSLTLHLQPLGIPPLHLSEIQYVAFSITKPLNCRQDKHNSQMLIA